MECCGQLDNAAHIIRDNLVIPKNAEKNSSFFSGEVFF
jgi:hypothetical protein